MARNLREESKFEISLRPPESIAVRSVFPNARRSRELNPGSHLGEAFQQNLRSSSEVLARARISYQYYYELDLN